MKRIILVCVFLLAANIVQADLKAYCVDKWSDDYEMQEYCLDNQREANSELFDFARRNNLLDSDGTLSTSPSGGAVERIVNGCMNKWELPKFDTFDFEMVMYCTNNQFEAYKRMNN